MKYFSATFIQTLKDAIVASVWFRDELRRFLNGSLTNTALLNQYDWKASNKRQIVDHLLDVLANDQAAYHEDFQRLIRGILEMTRYSGLETLEDANVRIAEARKLKSELQRLVASHNDTIQASKKEKEYQFLKEEYERRKKEDEARQQRRTEDDALRKTNPEGYFGKTLKLTGQVTRDHIKQQYKDLIRSYHPDRFQSLDVEFIELATRRAQQINEAYQYFEKKYGI